MFFLVLPPSLPSRLEREARDKEMHRNIAKLAAAKGKIHEDEEEARVEREKRDKELHKNIALLAAKLGRDGCEEKDYF